MCYGNVNIAEDFSFFSLFRQLTESLCVFSSFLIKKKKKKKKKEQQSPQGTLVIYSSVHV